MTKAAIFFLAVMALCVGCDPIQNENFDSQPDASEVDNSRIPGSCGDILNCVIASCANTYSGSCENACLARANDFTSKDLYSGGFGLSTCAVIQCQDECTPPSQPFCRQCMQAKCRSYDECLADT